MQYAALGELGGVTEVARPYRRKSNPQRQPQALRPLERTASLPRVWLLVAGISLAVLIALADSSHYGSVRASVAYVVPVILLVWGYGTIGGMVMTTVITAWNVVALVLLGGHGLGGEGQSLSVGAIVFNSVVLFTVLALVAGLSADLQERLSEERSIGRSDPLTGTLNRRALMERFEIERDRALRYGHPLAVMCIDLDHLKQTNDTHGHAAGDARLVALARAFQQSLRSSDLLARVGGDEFVVVLPETDLAGAVGIAQRATSLLKEEELANSTTVTASIGIAAFPTSDTDVGGMMEKGDWLLREAKREGPGGVMTGAFQRRV